MVSELEPGMGQEGGHQVRAALDPPEPAPHRSGQLAKGQRRQVGQSGGAQMRPDPCWRRLVALPAPA